MKNSIVSKFLVGITILAMLLDLLGNMDSAFASRRISSKRNAEDFKNKLNKLVPELQKRYGTTGTAIGLIQDGEVKYVLNFGYEDKSKNKAISEETIFQAASISKSLTAWGVMKLVEEGKISLDESVEKYLTRWHLPGSQFNRNEVTIKRLLSHTAGLNIHGYLGAEPDRKIPAVEESLSGEGFMNKELKIEMLPGNSFSYSGGGYTLLQLVIEEVTGKAFEKYMEEEILKPLGMENSSYRNNIENENMSKGYGYFGQEVPTYNFSEQAAAGLKTTVPDMMKFIMASMNGLGESSVLKRETIDLIHKPVLSTAALGVFAEVLPDGNRLLEHGGDNRGWHGIYGLIPEKKDGIVIFTNSDNGIDMREELFYHWIEYETGTMPDKFNSIERSRNIKLIGAAALGVMLPVYLLLFALSLKKGRRVFFLRNENKSLFKLFIRLFIPLTLAITLYAASYKMNLLPLNGGLKNIVVMIFIWMSVLAVTGLFSKKKSITSEQMM